MALDQLSYTKNWTNSSDFPTVEESEDQVRADLQFLFNEIATYINTNIADDGTNSSTIAFKSSVPSLSTKTTLLAVIEYLYDQISEITVSGVADHSVTTVKLSRVSDPGGAAVSTENIASAAVDLTTKVTGVLPTANGGLGVDISTTSGKGTARTALGLGAIATQNLLGTGYGGLGTAITDSSGKATARSNLGLGSLAVENVAPIAKGGTNASTVSEARTNLGLGDVAVEDVVPVSEGGTGATTAASARTNLNAQEKATAVTTEEVTVTSSGVTVTCSGVTSTNNIVVTCNPSYFSAWQNGNVRCTAQGENTITLTSDISAVVKANVLIFN